MTHSQFDKLIAAMLSAINAKVFEYLTRITLAGIAYQISVTIESDILRYAAIVIAMLLCLQLFFDLNTFFDRLANKVRFEPGVILKTIILIIFGSFVLATYTAAYLVIDAFNNYYLSG